MGFLAEAYRHHDYMLGRRNARSFLRRHFVLPIGNPLFGRKEASPRWSDDDVARWAVPRQEGGPADHLPVIPLCGRLWTDDPGQEDGIEPLPEWPRGRLDPASLTPLIRGRAEAATRLLYETQVKRMIRPAVSRMVETMIARRSWAVRQLLKPLRRPGEALLMGLLNRLVPRLPPGLIAETAEKQITTAVRALDNAH